MLPEAPTGLGAPGAHPSRCHVMFPPPAFCSAIEISSCFPFAANATRPLSISWVPVESYPNSSRLPALDVW